MFPIKFKIYQPTNPGEKIQTYIKANYNLKLIEKSVNTFISDFNSKHNALSNLNKISKEKTILQKQQSILISYLKQIQILQAKFPPKESPEHIRFHFMWKDILKEQLHTSDDLYYEYYNSLFNLGILFFVQGYTTDKDVAKFSIDENRCTEICQTFQRAMWCFQKLQLEVKTKLSKQDIPKDLEDCVLYYNSLFCMIYGYKYLVRKIQIQAKTNAKENGLKDAFITKMNSNLKQRLLILTQISNTYKKLHELATKEQTILAIKPEFLQYLKYQSDYYLAEKYEHLYDLQMIIFDKFQTNYENAIKYLKNKLDVLKPWAERSQSFANLLDYNLNKEIEKIEKQLQEMKYNNERIYRNKLVPYQEPILDDFKVLQPKEIENFNKPQDVNEHDLDSLVPKRVDIHAEKGKDQITNFINSQKKKYKSEEEIQKEISKLQLPSKLKSPIANTEDLVNQQLWTQIQDVKTKGGMKGLLDLQSQIKSISSDLEKKTRDLLKGVNNEAIEDNSNRTKYGNKWIVGPSDKYNKNFITNLENVLTRLSNLQVYDTKQNETVSQLSPQIEDLNLTRKALGDKFLQFERSSGPLTQNETQIQRLLNEIRTLSVNNKSIIAEIFQKLIKDGEFTKGYLEVEEKKIKEEVLLSKLQKKYEDMFLPIKNNDKKINDNIREIDRICKVILRDPNEIQRQKGIDNQKKEFENAIYAKINSFNNTHGALTKGFNFYVSEQEKIYSVLNSVIKFLNKRNEEKCLLLEEITKTKVNPPYQKIPELKVNVQKK